jgi:hypothetical protein
MHLYESTNSVPRWHNYCSLSSQLTRLASRGGRFRTSTRFRFFGGSVRLRGLAPAPFFIASRWLAGAGFQFPASVSSKWFSLGPGSFRALFFFSRLPFLISVGARHAVPAAAFFSSCPANQWPNRSHVPPGCAVRTPFLPSTF